MLNYWDIPVQTEERRDDNMYRITATLNETGNRFFYDLSYAEAMDMYRQLTVHYAHAYSDIQVEKI